MLNGTTVKAPPKKPGFGILVYALAAALAVLAIDWFLREGAQEASGRGAALVHGLRGLWELAEPARTAAGEWLATHSWRPFLMVTGGLALFGLLLMRGMPPCPKRSVIDFFATTSALLFVFSGTLYGAFLLTGNWHSAKLAVAALILFLLGARLKRVR